MKIRDNEPVTISMAWGVKQSELMKAGAIDILLTSDTNLFIDPILLGESSNEEFRKKALSLYQKRFSTIITLISKSKKENDVAWKAARKLFNFHEINYTHLGYSSGTSGSGIGEATSNHIFSTAKQVIDLGITDPDLFMALALLEEGIGPDRISDMTTNVICEALCEFTANICKKLNIKMSEFLIEGKKYKLPPNPLKNSEPIILTPKDIVRDLPIASDWSEVCAAAKQSEELRDRVNSKIGEIWAAKTRKQKEKIRENSLASKDAFNTLIDLMHEASTDSYNLKDDMRGEIYPADVRSEIANKHKLNLASYANKKLTSNDIKSIVDKIILKFQDLIENNGLWKELWDTGYRKSRNEKAVQRLFFAVASSYCDANDLDISPESDSGCGPVDFKFSRGAKKKVLVEIKKSNNSKLVDGYKKQLEAYKRAEKPAESHYVVVDIGNLTSEKLKELNNEKTTAQQLHSKASKIDIIDGSVRKSASKQ